MERDISATTAQWEYESVDCETAACHAKPRHSRHRTETTQYWAPATMENELRAQLRMLNVPEIDPNSLM